MKSSFESVASKILIIISTQAAAGKAMAIEQLTIIFKQLKHLLAVIDDVGTSTRILKQMLASDLYSSVYLSEYLHDKEIS